MPQMEACVSHSRPVNNCKVDENAFNQADFIKFKAQPSQARTDVVELEMASKGLLKNPKHYASESSLYDRARMHGMIPRFRQSLKDPICPSIRFINPMTGEPRQTLVETIEEKEILEGKTQRGLDHTDWRGFYKNKT